MSNIDTNNEWAAYAGPGGWNDPDMLEVGESGLSSIESRTHFALWCISKAPLIIGTDIRSISPDVLELLTHDELISINQDPLGVQARKVNVMGHYEVWAGPLANGDWVVLILNRSGAAASITASWENLGYSKTTIMSVRDVWHRRALGDYQGSFASLVGAHDTAVIRVTPVPKAV